MSMGAFSVRMSDELAARIDTIAEGLTIRASGANVKRSDATRLSVERGITVREAEFGLGAPKKGGNANK